MADTIKGKLVIDTQIQIENARKQLSELQQYYDKLKLPNELKIRVGDSFKELDKELSKLDKRMQGTFKTKGDLASIEKSTNAINKLYESLVNLTSRTSNLGSDIFGGISTKEITEIDNKIKALKQDLTQISKGLDFSKLDDVLALTGQNFDSIKNKVNNFKKAFSGSEIDIEGAQKVQNSMTGLVNQFKAADKAGKQLSSTQEAWIKSYDEFGRIIEDYKNKTQSLNNSIQQQESLRGQKMAEAIQKESDSLSKNNAELQKNQANVQGMTTDLQNSVAAMVSFETQARQVANRLTRIFSITGVATAFRRIVRDAISDVKELDEAMTSIAVVTDFSIGDLWNQVDEYSKLAQEKGVELKGVYDVQKLYYQQGRSAEDVSVLTDNTLEFARIAEMDYAAATDAMTVAVNAFNLKAEDSIKIVDIYSNLAAKAAVDQSELANAMSKVASMAASVGMSLETTSTFLTQIIETTR